MIAIVDYGSGNVNAIANIYERMNVDASIESSPEGILKADKIILPGVGAFDDSMTRLNESGLREVLDHQVLSEMIPVLGVCVGMQIMACSSEEGNEAGLGWFGNSQVLMLDAAAIQHKPKLPHMGWNNVYPLQNHSIFDGVEKEAEFYFLHSYQFICEDDNKLAVSNYGNEFVSAVRSGCIFGFQFHPEKSHSNGMNIFKNFANLN